MMGAAMACDAGAEPHLRIATVLRDSNGLSNPSLVLMSSLRICAEGAAQRDGGLGTKSGAHAPEELSSCTIMICPWCACACGLRYVPCGSIPSSVPAEGAVALYSARHIDDNTAACTATTTSRRLDKSRTTRAEQQEQNTTRAEQPRQQRACECGISAACHASSSASTPPTMNLSASAATAGSLACRVLPPSRLAKPTG